MAALLALATLGTMIPVRADAPALADLWNAPQIAWHSLKTGIPAATQSGKTVVMVFHASWCTACKQYRSVFKDDRIVAASKNFVMILVDADQDKIANGAFAPDGTYVPRTIFLSPDGDIRTDLVGKSDPKHPHTIDIDKPDELLALMTKAAGSEPKDDPTPDRRAEN
ncbi:MAG: thioredoxin family protein [Hyphomicrobium sp.]|nr:thioredoxin family protein [Hyphomicrobium sp.]